MLQILKETLDYSHKNGKEHLFWCKLCPTMHHKPKLSINIEKGVFKCWVCGANGHNLFYLIKKFGNKSQQEKWLELDKTVNLNEFDNLFLDSQEKKSVQKIELPKEYVPLSQVLFEKRYKKPIDYILKERGLSEYDIVRWRIGCCLTGEYGGRIIIPSFDSEGNLNHFIARDYTSSQHPYKEPSVKKSEFIFNEIEINWFSDSIVLVEGFFDSLKEENMIPLLGSTQSKSSKLLKRIIENNLSTYLALDEDAKDKAKKIARLILSYGGEVCFIDTSGYKDVDKMPYEVYKQRKKEAYCINSDNFYLL